MLPIRTLMHFADENIWNQAKNILLSARFWIIYLDAIIAQQVNTPYGPIKGATKRTNTGKTYYAYHSIPYAKPPTGSKRFLATELIDPWTEVYDGSTEKGKTCYQINSGSAAQTEDCLFLNIYTPQDPSSSGGNLPVFVNIHGGGFNAGSGASISPNYLIDEGLIVAVFNYRLGAFGFLSTGDDVIPGNAGISDQILALTWIQKNIAAFGGDPAQVTIAGQSAGAKSVGYLIMSPLATGLFSAGIMESGTQLCEGGYQRNHTDIAFKIGSFIDNQFDSSTDSKKLLETLQGVDPKTLDKAITSFTNWASQQPDHFEKNPMTQGYQFTPTVDSASSNPVLPLLQYESVANGNIHKVPIFLGICSEEGLMDGSYQNKELRQAYDNIPSLLNPQDMNIAGETAWKEVGNLIKEQYSYGSFVENPLGVIQYFTDQEYARGSIKHAQLQSAFTDVFYYQFSYTGDMGGGNHGYPGSGNVSHVGEMNYIYGGNPLENYSQADQLMSKRLVKFWANFAKYRNPTPNKDELLQNITWPKVKTDNFQYVYIGNFENTDLTVVQGKPKADGMAFWDNLYTKYGNRPFDTY